MLNKSAIVYSDSVMQLRTYLMPMDKTNITINWKEDRNILFYQSVFDNFAYQYQKVGGKTVSNRLYHVFRVLMSNERLEKFGIRTKYTELETKPVSKQSSSQVFGFLIGMNDDVNMTNIMSDDIDDQGVFTEEDNKIANNYAAMA